MKGITSWGCVSGVEQLNVHGTNVMYNKPKSVEKDETPLEPNHTDFIFIDDGTKHQMEAEIQFRNAFERTISGESCSLQSTTKGRSSFHKRRYLFPSNLDSIPVVLVVIEGGIDTIKKGFDLFSFYLIRKFRF